MDLTNLSPAVIDEIVRALQFKILAGINPHVAQSALTDLLRSAQTIPQATAAATPPQPNPPESPGLTT
jgi:hypothetical protein